MVEPVIACKDGHVFEKASIEEWLKTRKTCPVCRCPIDSKDMKVNRYLKDEIHRWKASTSFDSLRLRHEPVLEVEESDKAIRQILMNYSIQPSGRMKENRRLLKQLSEELHRKLVYVSSK